MTATHKAAEPNEYPMRRWVFHDALGRYDIDLGDSHIDVGTTSQLELPRFLALGYGVDRGTPELIHRIASRYGGSDSQVIVTHGSQEALYLLYATLLQRGDQVIAFRPGWQQAWEAPQRLGARVNVLPLSAEFSIDLEALEEAAGPRLRLIVVNTPCNPTGRRVRRHEMDAILALAERSGAHVIVDEEYVLDLSGSVALGNPRVISVSSLSKTAGFPGLRVGWMYGASEILTACADYKHLTSISNSVLCEAAAAAILARWPEFAARYDRIVSAGLRQLTEFAGDHQDAVRLVLPEGTPFAWLHLATGESSLALAFRALDTGVMLMPGETLGMAGGIRITFARKPEILAEGLSRISKIL